MVRFFKKYEIFVIVTLLCLNSVFGSDNRYLQPSDEDSCKAGYYKVVENGKNNGDKKKFCYKDKNGCARYNSNKPSKKCVECIDSVFYKLVDTQLPPYYQCTLKVSWKLFGIVTTIFGLIAIQYVLKKLKEQKQKRFENELKTSW